MAKVLGVPTAALEEASSLLPPPTIHPTIDLNADADVESPSLSVSLWLSSHNVRLLLLTFRRPLTRRLTRSKVSYGRQLNSRASISPRCLWVH
jgi:hypothetical protein|eukprot:COSAG01_NODE_2079_length_8464_cov_7.812821_5_plen_93_part_00